MFRAAFGLSHLILGLVLVGLCVLKAQAQSPEPNPEALKAFGDMVKAWRAFPALGVKTTVKIEMMDGDVAASSDEIKGEFLFGPRRSAVVKLRGFTCYMTPAAADAKPEPGMDSVPGSISAVHEGDSNSYFTSTDDGSPYYALLNCFVDMPFPAPSPVHGD